MLLLQYTYSFLHFLRAALPQSVRALEASAASVKRIYTVDPPNPVFTSEEREIALNDLCVQEERAESIESLVWGTILISDRSDTLPSAIYMSKYCAAFGSQMMRASFLPSIEASIHVLDCAF